MNTLISKTSVVIPAKNESEGLSRLLPKLKAQYPTLREIIVVDDGSSDETRKICDDNGVKCIVHAQSKGNGAAIKRIRYGYHRESDEEN